MNTKRMNRLEELGRVDAEKADTRKGKRNLREEKSRIVRELKADGGKVKRKKMRPDDPNTPRRGRRPGARDKKRGKFPDLTGDGKVTRADVLKGRGVFKSGGIAKRGRGCEIR
jgi:predicted flap endonuclease-1-like 5' DNA nuclease